MALGRKPIEIVNEGKHQLLTKAGHWERIYLKEVAKVQNGYAFSSSKFVKSSGLPLIRIRDIGNTSTVDRYIGEYSNDFVVKNGDLLIGMDGDFKIAIWKGEDALLNQRVCRIIPNSKRINPKFLFICLQPYLNAINEETSSVTVKHLSSRTIEEIPLPYPSLSEQVAIVSKIEELLSDLENGKQQLQIAQQQLKVYRQSLLKAAFEGKLTEKKGEWGNVKLGEIAYAIDPQPSHRTPPIVQNGIPYISIKDFDYEADRINFNSARKVSHKVLEDHLSRYTLMLGDFVIGKIGTIGKPVRIVLPQDYTLSANIVLIQPRKINPTYLYYFFQSNFIEKAFFAGRNATTQAAFGIQKVRELRVELPAQEEQQDIVDELESKLTVCDKIEETINQSLQQAETLRQSILKMAFEGRLIQF